MHIRRCRWSIRLNVVTPGGENYISTIDNMLHVINVKNVSVTTYQNVLDFIESADDSTQTYRALDAMGTEITGAALLSALLEGTRIEVTAEDGVTVQAYTLNNAHELRIMTESLDPVYLGTAQIDTVIPVADVSGSLEGKYFMLTTAAGGHYYVWYDKGVGAVDPAPAGCTGIKVSNNTNDDADAIGTKTAAALSASLSGICEVKYESGNLNIIQLIRGNLEVNIYDVNTEFTFWVPQAGVNPPPYSDSLEQVYGSAPVSFSEPMMLLPAGLTLAADGSITGACTSNTPADLPIQFMCTDSKGATATKTIILSLVDGAA
jgi:hypothetical protein